MAECSPARAPSGPARQGAGIDEQRAATLIAELVATMVAAAIEEEREECAQIAETLEAPGPETISILIRDRGLAG